MPYTVVVSIGVKLHASTTCCVMTELVAPVSQTAVNCFSVGEGVLFAGSQAADISHSLVSTRDSPCLEYVVKLFATMRTLRSSGISACPRERKLCGP